MLRCFNLGVQILTNSVIYFEMTDIKCLFSFFSDVRNYCVLLDMFTLEMHYYFCFARNTSGSGVAEPASNVCPGQQQQLMRSRHSHPMF
jgi:hypothetical protein